MSHAHACHYERVVTVDADLAVNRRERKKRETRDALEAAALRLFAEKGYDETTVKEIAEAADVAVRTFFRYFQSKQHVLFGDVAHDVTGRLRAALEAQPASVQPAAAVGNALEVLGLSSDDEQLFWIDGDPKPESESDMKWSLSYVVQPDYITC